MDKAVNYVEKSSRIGTFQHADNSSQAAIGIFLKQPLPGRVKTRLCPPLNNNQAAELYRVATDETVEKMCRGPFRVILFYVGEVNYFMAEYPGLPCISQVEGDLGQRMNAAINELLEAGFATAMLIGSDSPDLPLEQVKEARELLAYHTVVTVPSADGGYVLVGASSPSPEVFINIPWSSSEVLAATRLQAGKHGIDYRETGGWQDIDDVESLRLLLQRSPESRTARYVRENFGRLLNAKASG